MRRTQKPLLFVLLFVLSACTYQPVFTLEVITPMPTASATSFVEVTETPPVFLTPTALPVPSSTPPAIFKLTDFSPVLYGGKLYQTNFFLLLGGVTRDDWLAPEESVSRFSGEATYSFNTMEYASKYFAWGKSPQYSPACQLYTLGTEADFDEAGMVAVLDGWNVTKRDVTELSAEGEFYQQEVVDWLRTQGVDAPQMGILQIFRVDLEGDGVDEIFISATHLDGSQHATKAGDYSVILMRKLIGNEAITQLVVGDVYNSLQSEITFPRTYSLENFIDLNQDGVLEVVVGFLEWEGVGAFVYQVDGQNLIEVLSAGC